MAPCAACVALGGKCEKHLAETNCSACEQLPSGVCAECFEKLQVEAGKVGGAKVRSKSPLVNSAERQSKIPKGDTHSHAPLGTLPPFPIVSDALPQDADKGKGGEKGEKGEKGNGGDRGKGAWGSEKGFDPWSGWKGAQWAQGGQQGKGEQGGSTGDDMAKLFSMMSNMPTKDDLLTFKSDIKNEVKIIVSEAVDPIKDEMATLSERV